MKSPLPPPPGPPFPLFLMSSSLSAHMAAEDRGPPCSAQRRYCIAPIVDHGPQQYLIQVAVSCWYVIQGIISSLRCRDAEGVGRDAGAGPIEAPLGLDNLRSPFYATLPAEKQAVWDEVLRSATMKSAKPGTMKPVIY